MKPIKNLSHYLWMLILAIVLVLVIIVLWNIYAPVKSEEMLIKIKKGDTAATIAEKLEQNGVIRSKFLFRTLAAMRGTDKHLIAGTYTIGGKHNLLQTLKMLEEGNVTAVRVTIPEGFSMYQTLHRLERSGLARYEDLYKEATNPDFVYQLTGFKVKSLEGFLYPDTYAFDPDVTVQEILSIMTMNFFNTLKKAGIDPYTIDNFYDKLILASIVEKESNYPEERQLVAGVIYNRLRAGMKLASCSTVNYILEQRGIKKKVLSFEDTKIPSPYNTYINYGLPPTPICNPSLSSIMAALNPAETDYYYFVSDRDGRNDFSRTAEEHLAKAKKYRRKEWE